MQFKQFKIQFLASVFLFSGLIAKSQSFSVDINMPPQQMVQNLVGPGVTISNLVVTACDSTFGYYNSVNTELGTSQGLLLTTGKALYSVGPNNSIGNCSTSAGTCDYFDNNCPGSALLNQAQDRLTRDATQFEFDIVPQGDSLRFKYTFASEEYLEWVNSPFNDIFGFFISGPNIGTDVNIALIPNSSQIVSINTVNHLQNTQYFYNNQNPLGQFIQYDGFTVGLSAVIGNLIPCETYHLKLVIADGTDYVYDSGVFINSIESNPVVVLTATSNGLDYMVEGCNTGTVSFSRQQPSDQPQDVLFWLGGTATNGIDFTPQIGSGIPFDQNVITIPANSQTVSFDISAALDDIPEGQEYLTVYLGNPLCSGAEVLDSVNFYIYDFLDINILPETSDICAGQCVELTAVSSVINLANFVWTGDVSDPQSLIVEVCPTITTDYSIMITVGDCVASDTTTVNVSSITVELTASDVNCATSATGSITVNVLNAIEPYLYDWTGPNGYTSSDANPSNLAPGEYCVTVTDGAGCTTSGCISVIQTNVLSASSILSSYSCSMISCTGVCDGGIDITVIGGIAPFTYVWTGPDGFTYDEQDATNLCVGTYELTITDSVGCAYSNTYTLLEPSPVDLVVVGTVDLLCSGIETGEASVQASGGCSPYTYSWSHSTSVTGPVAIELASGTYEVSVTDQNGCNSAGTVTIVINDPINPMNVSVDQISVYPGGYSVSCPGATDGFIDLTITGGSTPYTTSWFNLTTGSVFSTAEDLANAPCGIYNLTVMDDLGCPYTQSLQLSCVPAIDVQYTVVNNPCGLPDTGGGSIDVTSTTGGQGAPYGFEWTGPSCSPCLTDDISNLNSGDYVLVVTDAQGCTATFTANIGENDSFTATGDVTPITCAGACNGSIAITTSGSGGPGVAMTVDASTQMTFCITANHTYVSDIAYWLVGPPSCGSPSILLAPNPGSNCNSGDNVVNLCFSNTSTNNYNVCTPLPQAPVTGTYGTYGVNTIPITWSDIYGCNAADPGWALQIWDCVAGDFGTLLTASMSFSGTDSNNQPLTIDYNSEPGFSADIVATSCSPALAATWTETTGAGGGGTGGDYTYTWTGPFTGPVPTSEDVSELCAGTYTVVIAQGDCNQTLTFTLLDPEPILINSTIVNPTCFGQNNGSIDITIIGGSGNYTYAWAESAPCFFPPTTTQDISSLFACSYTVVVTDVATGCTATATIVLDAPQVMDIVVVTSQFDGGYNVSCNAANDGQISVFVTGGSPDCNLFTPFCYQYDWITDCSEINPADFGNDPNAPNADNLPGGTYGINVTDANGCLATTCLDLLEPGPLDSPAIIQDIDCNNSTGCITPSLSGGSGNYVVFAWTGNIGANSPSATTLCGLQAGPYSLTVTDSNNCQDTFDYIIEEIPVLTATVVSTTDASCNGVCNGSVSIQLQGGEAPITCVMDGIPYVFGNVDLEVINDLCAGSYTMVHTDVNGCEVTSAFVIDEPQIITIDLATVLQEAGQIFSLQCLGDSSGAINATISGGTFPYTFEWTDEVLNIISIEEDVDSLIAGNYCLTVTDFNSCTMQNCIEITEPETPLNVTAVISIYHDLYNVSCYGATDGSIDITVTGGVGPYTFNWNGDGTIEDQEDQIGLGAGLYNVLVVDANFCQFTLEFELIEPTPIIVDATLSSFDDGFNISCNGQCDGTITISVTGGDPGVTGYTISWTGPNGFSSSSLSLTGLCAGDYEVTVTDENDCSVIESYSIIEPEVLTLAITQNYNCITGTLDLCADVTGGSGTYTYVWQNDSTSSCIIGSTDGQYCVTVTDSNGCIENVCVTIDVNTPLNLTSVVVDATCGLCNGSIDITISGGFPPYSFFWVSGQTTEDLSDLCAGTYTITVTDAIGCIITQAYTVLDAPGVDVTTTQINVACNADSTGSATAVATGGTPVITYSWLNAAGTEISTETSISQLPAGDYTINVTDGAGCTAQAIATILEAPALNLDVEVSVHGLFNISVPNGNDGAIEVTVTGGTPQYTYTWTPTGTGQNTNAVTGLSAGTYNLSVVDANGCTADTSVTLTAPRELKLYTALSPNGDGFNDFYVIDGVTFCKGNVLKVFNRWGSLVYSKTNYANEWYGQDQGGGILADGTYFVTFEGCSKEISTYVDLRRE